MKFSDKILLLPIIILSLNFIYRLIDFSSIIYRFPLDITNDLTGYIPDVIFLGQYGFFGHVPTWYNGFILFNIYPPGWVLFTFTLFKLTNHIMLAVFLSAIILLFMGAIGVSLIGTELKWSKLKKIALFLFIYANPMSIGAIFKQGRLPSLMALTLLIYLFYISLYFKERELNWKAILLPVVYGLLILTHQTETVLGSAFLLGLLLIKSWKERIKILGLLILSLVLSSFWLVHFINAAQQTGFLNFNFGYWLLDWSSFFWSNLIGALLSVAFFITFTIFYKQNKNKKWLFFFIPSLIFNFLYLTRLVLFVPILKYIYPDPWQDFLMLNVSLLFLSLHFDRVGKSLQKYIALAMVILALCAVGYNIYKTPFMQEWDKQDKEAIGLIPLLDPESHFIMFSEYSKTLYSRAIYSYAAIYYNISSASGWFEINKEYSYIKGFNDEYKDFLKTEDCQDLNIFHNVYNTTEILANGHYCEKISSCGWNTKETNGSSCILNYSSANQQE